MNGELNYAFMSDSAAPAHRKVMNALTHVNAEGHMPMYGDDRETSKTQELFRNWLGQDIEVFFVFGGTGANVLGLSTLLRPHQAVICADSAHINQDEAGAPERFTGSKLLTVPNEDGKVRPETLADHMNDIGDQHHVQPKVISISQPTEYGTVYTYQELRRLAEFAHGHDLYLHVDGARIANAVASHVGFRSADLGDAGVDVISFGGTKNGMMYGEAVIFFRPHLADRFQWIRKQGMQLPAKMCYIAAQFRAMFGGDLWLKNARNANNKARQLAACLDDLDQHTKIMRPVQSNAVFVRLPRGLIAHLHKRYACYAWDDDKEIRLMTSWATEDHDIRDLVEYLKSYRHTGLGV